MTSSNEAAHHEAPVGLLAVAWRVGTFRARLWAVTWFAWFIYYLIPLATGWLLKRVFDALASDDAVGGWLIGIGLTEVVRMIVFAFAIWFVIRWWTAALTVLRTNMLRAQTVSGGPHRADLPIGPAESISRFHDDARDAVVWADSWLDGLGHLTFGVIAIAVMMTVDLAAALVALIPLVLVSFAIGWVRPRLYEADERDREATGAVTGFLGETFSGTLAFRLAGKEGAAISRLGHHTEVRRRTAVRKVLLEQALDGLSSTTANVMVGLMLVALVPVARRGELSIGDLALLVSYATVLGEGPRFYSRLVTAGEQARVSVRRMRALVAPDRPQDLLADTEISIERRDPVIVRDADPARVRLARLELRGVTAVHPSTGGGVRDLDLVVEAGQFVVITGAVGSGKSTLLRALAGLMPLDGGTVSWNGEQIGDLGAWMVPPQAAYLPQVPRLFSETLRENIALGRPADEIDRVVAAAALGPDLAEMPDGVETKVGARGLRLSGGQAQRVAAARSLLTSPELLLIDDLSSAVDVETERTLWSHVRDRGTTVLAVSHRGFVIDMADKVVELK